MKSLETVACCGLFCEACSVFIASHGDEKALEAIAVKMNAAKEEIRCSGCRSEKLGAFCLTCEFKRCAQERGIRNCEDCDEFPCTRLHDFKVKMPHRIELFESARYRKEHGIERWKEKMAADYACKDCGTINSPYYLKCKRCGRMPGNDYIKRNGAEIKKFLGV